MLHFSNIMSVIDLFAEVLREIKILKISTKIEGFFLQNLD